MLGIMRKFTCMEASSSEIGNSKKVLRKNSTFTECKESEDGYDWVGKLCGTVLARFGELWGKVTFSVQYFS